VGPMPADMTASTGPMARKLLASAVLYCVRPNTVTVW
jgi:hypothetical protein